jgi:hypothetical protein
VTASLLMDCMAVMACLPAAGQLGPAVVAAHPG